MGRHETRPLLLLRLRPVWKNSGREVYDAARRAAGSVRTCGSQELRLISRPTFDSASAKSKQLPSSVKGSAMFRSIQSRFRVKLTPGVKPEPATRADAPHTRARVRRDSTVQVCHR